VKEVGEEKKDYRKKKKTTLTLPTIYQEKDGNVLEQNLKESNGY
jgi:hypothetical protein